MQRYLSKYHIADTSPKDLDEAISRADWNLSVEELAVLHGRLAEVLATGDFIFVVAAQRFTPAMVRALEYLNAKMRHGRFYLVEVVHLKGRDLTAHAAQVVAAPVTRSASPTPGSPTQANETDFLAGIPAAAHRDAMKDIFAACATLGLTVRWGAKGASIRIQTPDRAEPLSVGWAFLDGDQWYGARHLTLGVDHTSLDQTPSVEGPVKAFIQSISVIEGAQRVSSKLDAYTFTPHTTPTAQREILAALEAMVSAVQGRE